MTAGSWTTARRRQQGAMAGRLISLKYYIQYVVVQT